MPAGTQVPDLRRSTTSSGVEGWCNQEATRVCTQGHGYCATNAFASDHSIARIDLGTGSFGMLPGCSAFLGVSYISSGFVCPRCCGHRVLTALVFSGRGAGVSYRTDEKGHGATRPGSYTVYPAGLRVVSQ